jgi:flagellar hook-basal body complex protein FliE
MIDGISGNSSLDKLGATGGAAKAAGAGAGAGATSGAGGASFADTLKNSINEVSKLQQDASQAVQDLATGKTDDVTGVMTAMEKSDLAFKTLLAIRAKLMDAYEEIKGISV